MDANPSEGPKRAADPRPWPLVGRDEELALALATIAANGSVVFTGAPGVGKTRLAHEVLDGEDRRGARTEWIAATEAASAIPLGAAARLVPADAVGGGREAMLAAIVAALGQASSGRRRLVLGVDDAHLLDHVSAALVHLLVTSGTASAVVTVRQREPVPDAISRLWEDGSATLIELQPLARPEVEVLVAGALDGLIDGALAGFVWESSRGSPLYLRELIRDGLQSRALRADGGVWRWYGDLKPSRRLQDLVALRMGRLDDDERAALEVIAVGGRLNHACIRHLGHDGAVARLERRELLTVHGQAREVGFAHPLFGEVVRATIPLSRLDDIRRQLADGVEATTDMTPQDAIRVALWRAECGDRSHPAQLESAARHAWVVGASVVAEQLARAALEAGAAREAGYLLGEALSDLSRTEEALAAWRSAEQLPGPDHLLADIARGQAGVLAYQLDRPDEARDVYLRALARISDENLRKTLLGVAAVLAEVHPAARGFNIPAASPGASEPGLLVPGAALATATRGLATGQFDSAVATIDAALANASDWEQQEPTIAVLLALTRVWALALGGQVGKGRDDADAEYGRCLMRGGEQPRARWCLARGMIAVLIGRPRQAISILEEGAAMLERADTGFLRPTRAQLAMAYALIGDVPTARHNARAAEVARQTLDGVFAVDVMRAGAWVRAAAGESSIAARRLLAAAEHAATTGHHAYEALALHDLARFGAPARAAMRLEELSTSVDGPLMAAFAAHARALAEDDAGALEAVSRSFADLGCDLFAAEASAAAARGHRRAGRKASGFATAERARELAGRCEGAGTALLVALDRPGDLTAREREVADLAAAGLASREIGDRLGISTRTVDNLLGRVYSKLGVSGRDDLTTLLRGGSAPA